MLVVIEGLILSVLPWIVPRGVVYESWILALSALIVTEGLHAFSVYVEDGHELSRSGKLYSSVLLSVRESQFRRCGRAYSHCILMFTQQVRVSLARA